MLENGRKIRPAEWGFDVDKLQSFNDVQLDFIIPNHSQNTTSHLGDYNALPNFSFL